MTSKETRSRIGGLLRKAASVACSLALAATCVVSPPGGPTGAEALNSLTVTSGLDGADPETLSLTGNGYLPLTEATFSSKSTHFKFRKDLKSSHDVRENGGKSSSPGVWWDGKGSQDDLEDGFSLTWKKAVHDWKGSWRYGSFKLVFKDIGLHRGAYSSGVSTVKLVENGVSSDNEPNGVLHFCSWTTANGAADNFRTIGVHMTVEGHLGADASLGGNMLLAQYDIDQPDHTVAPDSAGNYPYDGTYAESLRLGSGVADTIWVSEGGEAPTGLAIDRGKRKIRGTTANSKTRSWKNGFIASLSEKFTLEWWGSDCSTGFFQAYRPAKVYKLTDGHSTIASSAYVDSAGNGDSSPRRYFKSDAATDASSGGGDYVSYDLVPWKAKPTYEFAAKKGYHVKRIWVNKGSTSVQRQAKDATALANMNSKYQFGDKCKDPITQDSFVKVVSEAESKTVYGSAGTSITVTKTLVNGTSSKAGAVTMTLQQTDSATSFEQSKKVSWHGSGGLATQGSATFKLNYAYDGPEGWSPDGTGYARTYSYQVTESQSPGSGTWTPGGAAWVFTVTVHLVLDRTVENTRYFEMSVDQPSTVSGSSDFTNYMTAPVNWGFDIVKALVPADPSEGGIAGAVSSCTPLTFLVSRNEDMSDAFPVSMASSYFDGATGTARYVTRFDKQGEYDFYVTESAGSAPGWTWDGGKHHVKATVSIDESFRLYVSEVSVDGAKAAPDNTHVGFTNYETRPVDWSFKVEKTIGGLEYFGDSVAAALENSGAISFNVYLGDTPRVWAGSVPMPAASFDNPDKKGAGTYQRTFSSAGTYTFHVSEAHGGALHWAWDSSEHTIVVTVSMDSDDHSLYVSEVRVNNAKCEDPSAVTVPFVNSYSRTGGIQLRKVVTTSPSRPLGGVYFDVFADGDCTERARNAKGDFLAVGPTSDEDGSASVYGVPNGTYWLKERVPDGAVDMGDGIYGYEHHMIDTNKKYPVDIKAQAGASDYVDTTWIHNEATGEGTDIGNAPLYGTVSASLSMRKAYTSETDGSSLLRPGEFSFVVGSDEAAEVPVEPFAAGGAQTVHHNSADPDDSSDFSYVDLGEVSFSGAEVADGAGNGIHHVYYVREVAGFADESFKPACYDDHPDWMTWDEKVKTVDVYTYVDNNLDSKATVSYYAGAVSSEDIESGKAGTPLSAGGRDEEGAGSGFWFRNSWSPKGQIKLKKTDEDGEPLSGAVFFAENAETHLWRTFVSDDDGVATSVWLPLGKYKVSELSAPNGYVAAQPAEGDDCLLSVDVSVAGRPIDLTWRPIPNKEGETDVELGAVKATSGKRASEGQFSFKVLDEDLNQVYNYDEDGNGTAIVAANAADGTVTFPAIHFKGCDENACDADGRACEERVYYIAETAGADSGWHYDTVERKVTVRLYKAVGGISADVEYAAPDVHLVTYDAMGGHVGDGSPRTYLVGSGSLAIPNPTYEGRTFAGWTSDALGISTPTADLAIDTSGETYGKVGELGDVDLKAHWS